ncbi:hypothetical protein L1987_27860 [Smallanthus sonchifolius]|uniref:Uncharacterized protein n=1 Tax=Smallanthus sonchifolius TaxID=185202 RepID=A0ACB9ICA4_9ASTR|nr:hypothetical protein L1987_27860 [Smallanthus sonchifolius]
MYKSCRASARISTMPSFEVSRTLVTARISATLGKLGFIHTSSPCLQPHLMVNVDVREVRVQPHLFPSILPSSSATHDGGSSGSAAVEGGGVAREMDQRMAVQPHLTATSGNSSNGG